MFKIGDPIYFYSEQECQEGYIQKINKNTYNILVNDSRRKEGYQLWRVTEFFLSKNKDEAKEKWDDYKHRLKEYKKLLKTRRELNEFHPGINIIVQSLNEQPYQAEVLEVNRISLNVLTVDNRLMKVDKAISEPFRYNN